MKLSKDGRARPSKVSGAIETWILDQMTWGLHFLAEEITENILSNQNFEIQILKMSI